MAFVRSSHAFVNRLPVESIESIGLLRSVKAENFDVFRAFVRIVKEMNL